MHGLQNNNMFTDKPLQKYKERCIEYLYMADWQLCKALVRDGFGNLSHEFKVNELEAFFDVKTYIVFCFHFFSFLFPRDVLFIFNN